MAGELIPNCPFAITTFVNAESENASRAILVIEYGIVIDSNKEHP